MILSDFYLIEKVENVLKRMRWKAHFFLKGDKVSDQNNRFGLPSNKTPPTILEMKSFENDVINLIENIEISSWEVVTYGIYARVNLFSQNERASATSE